MSLHPEHNRSVLADEDQPVNKQTYTKLAHGRVGLVWTGRVELCTDDGKCNHDGAMEELGYSFEERIDAEANIEHNDLQPGEPEDGKETDIGRDS